MRVVLDICSRQIFAEGKLKVNGSLDAARRELGEELALEVVELGAVLLERKDPGSDFAILLTEVIVRGDPVALEHDEIRWLHLDDILALPLAPADRAFAEVGLSF